MAGKSIETGVDKLVSLINDEERISVKDAARELGVSEKVVEEWAEFLDEEGIISLEYKLATLYLVKRRLTHKEVEDKHKEFTGKKLGFIRRAETMLASLEKDNTIFQEIKDKFQLLKKEMSKDLSGVKLKLTELDKYEQVKGGLDKEIESHQKVVIAKMANLTKEIEKEKQKYHDILLEMCEEGKVLEKSAHEAVTIRRHFDMIRAQMIDFKKAMKEIEQQLRKEEHNISKAEANIGRLGKKAGAIQNDLVAKMDSLDDIIKEKGEKERIIMNKENAVLMEAMEKGRTLREESKAGRNMMNAFKTFFSQKKQVQSMIDQVNQARDDLEQDLALLIKKAKALRLVKKQNFLKHAEEVQGIFLRVGKKKTKYEHNLKNLMQLFHRKHTKKKRK